MDYIGIAIRFLGSFGLFIFGISLLSRGLQKTAGSKMKRILAGVSKNRFSGVLFGAGVTALIQSSAATTVMAVGFVNAGIIALPQIVGIIMGANVGTTMTSWLVSSVEWAEFLRPDAIGAVCAAAGALLLLFSKGKRIRNISEVIVGFGVLFLGLSQMPAALRPLAELDFVGELFLTMGANPILGIIAGVIVTVIIQSSAASIGILQSMALAGLVPWNAAIYIVLGQNLGTCLTAVISAIGATKNAKAAAYIHLVYNIMSAAVFGVASVIFFTFINGAAGAFAVSATNISMIHTGYNIASIILLFPFGKIILKISGKMAGIGKPGGENDESDLPELDEHILQTPQYALENSKSAILKLMRFMRANLVVGISLFLEKDYKKTGAFWKQAERIEKINTGISEFLTELYNTGLSSDESVLAAAYIHITISLKRISNRVKGFTALAASLRDSGIKDSYAGARKVMELYERTMLCYKDMIGAFESGDTDLINKTMCEADNIDKLRVRFKAEHFKPVSGKEHKVEIGMLYSEAARHLARITHNIKSVVETIPHTEKPEEAIGEAFIRR